ncbi:MAG: glutamyl-tRNA reductase [Desulfobacteraceae bacterium 4572_35.1]|nr:MAG: glutamyl-tRNA reductase [Desulfobacteraceae bacterium 4572_35.1]
MDIIVVGLSHKTAPVAVRETVAFAPENMQQPLEQICELPDVAEAVIVSTCNRVELYAATNATDAALAQLKQFLADYHNLDFAQLEKHLYTKHGEEAIRHVFEVASSLDSMVIGEPQILGQIKTAYGYAAEFKSVGLILNRFLHKAFSVAKRVRTETNIAGNAVSVSFAAVELARKIFGSVEGKTVMLVGAGEMCELAAKHFINNGVNRVLVTNRTFARAEKLANEFSGHPVLFENFKDQLHQADIVLSSTGASNFIVGVEQVTSALRLRKNRPMFFIDIAVPRDIDPRVNDINNVYLYDVDDLQGVVNANLKERHKEAASAHLIIEYEIGQFQSWMAGLDVVPTIVSLRRKVDELRQQELDKTFSQLKHLNEDDRKAIIAMSSALMNKILHPPTKVLKLAQKDDGAQQYVDALQRLFELEIDAPEGKLKDVESV